MFANWTGWKTLKLFLTGVGVGAGALSTSAALPPSIQAVAQVVGAIDGSVLAIVIVLSGTSLGPTLARTVTK